MRLLILALLAFGAHSIATGKIKARTRPTAHLDAAATGLASVTIDSIGSLVDMTIHERPDVEATSTHKLVKGCGPKTTTYASFGSPREEDDPVQAGMVTCCDLNGQGASRKYASNNSCLSGQDESPGTAAKVNWNEADAKCKSEGKRLCANQAEVDKACGGGCNYDYGLVWTSETSMEATTIAEPTTEAPSSCQDNATWGGNYSSHDFFCSSLTAQEDALGDAAPFGKALNQTIFAWVQMCKLYNVRTHCKDTCGCCQPAGALDVGGDCQMMNTGVDSTDTWRKNVCPVKFTDEVSKKDTICTEDPPGGWGLTASEMP